MESKEEIITRYLKKTAAQAYWTGIALGQVGGIGLGIVIAWGW
jgi:hypothetical protein